LIVSIKEITQVSLRCKNERLELMPLDVGAKPPVINVVCKCLLKAFTPCSCVLITNLKPPAWKVIEQTIKITERCEPKVPSGLLLRQFLMSRFQSA